MNKIVVGFFSLFLVCCKQPSSTKPFLNFKDSLLIEQLTAIDLCVHLKKISGLNADEVYRFSHGEAFCFYKQRVTISRTGDIISLHYLEYSGTDDGNVIEYRDKTFGPNCRIEKQFYKGLEKSRWKELEMKIKEANYWQLEKRDSYISRDGSPWQIDAYSASTISSNGKHVHSVNRNTPNNSFFSALGLFFMELAGEKGMCDEFK